MARPKKAVSKSKVPSDFGRIVAQYRRNRGLTQAELADRAEISTGYIGMIETGLRGDRPSLAMVEKLIKGLNLSSAQANVMASAAGYKLNFKGAVSEETVRPSFLVFVDGDPLMDRAQKRTMQFLYKQFVGRQADVTDGVAAAD